MSDPDIFRLTIPEGIDSDQMARLTACLSQVLPGDRFENGTVPIIAPALLLGHSALHSVAEKMRAPSGMGVVHESQSFEVGQGLIPGQPLNVDVSETAQGTVRIFAFSTKSVSGGVANTMQTRLRVVSPDDMARMKGSLFGDHLDKGDVAWRVTNPFTQDAVSTYLELSGDTNPIHTSEMAARAVGLDTVVVPGMMFSGLIEPAVQALPQAASIQSLRLRFMAPVAIGDSLDIGV